MRPINDIDYNKMMNDIFSSPEWIGAMVVLNIPFAPYWVGKFARDGLALAHHKLTKSDSFEESRQSVIFKILFPGMNSFEKRINNNEPQENRLIGSGPHRQPRVLGPEDLSSDY